MPTNALAASLAAALLPLAASAGDPAAATALKRGEYLVRVGGCDDCHTPHRIDAGVPVPDMTRRLSGHPAGARDPSAAPGPGDAAVVGPTFTSFRLPFGVVYATNLTPDERTGMGIWTEQEFVTAMRSGRHLGGPGARPILPPMPWFNVGAMTDDDLQAVWAYLRSLPAVANAVPEPKVPPQVIQGLSAALERTQARARPAPGAAAPAR